MIKTLLLALLLLSVLPALGDDIRPPRINIFPKPSSVVDYAGSFRFAKHVTIFASPVATNEAQILTDLLSKGAITASVKEFSGRPEREGSVFLELDKSVANLGDEGYALTVTGGSVRIRAAGSAGIFYGIQSLRQLLPSDIESAEKAPNAKWSVPCCQIVDKPKFGWRGMLLDVSRHFFTKDDIKHFLDLLAMHKMNVFHWHLTDDGGWRVEMKKHPKLTSVGAWRIPSKEVWDYGSLSFPGPGSGQTLYGGFYTQDDVRELVKYASDRHITIVPEIEMPGHSLAAMASTPELTCNVPLGDFQKESGLLFPNVYCAGKEKSFQFLQDVIDEVCDLFPSKYIHIGGDEVDKFLWSHCPDCQARMKAEGLKTPEELQSYFVRRIEKYINSKGKRLLGWDEILEGGLAPNATVMSWRGTEGGIAAAKAGHDVVMTPTSHCYFDYAYSTISTEHVLGFEPVPAALTAAQGTHILGGQCNLWTEWVPDMPTAEQRLFPRLVPMAEILWSEHADTNPDTFDDRLQWYYPRLLDLSLNFYIPKPVADFDAVFLDGSGKVNFTSAPLPGAVIRFTTDGTEPSAQSPICKGAIEVHHPGTVVAALFLNGQKSESTTIAVSARPNVDPRTLLPGLAWRAYDGVFNVIPDFKTMVLSATGTTQSVGLAGDRKLNYALQITGYLKIEKEGVYRLYVNSDDGSALWLGGAKVVDNDGLHGTIEKSGRVMLKPGIYPLTVGFVQAGGDQSLTASIEGPGLPKQAIPTSMLWQPAP